MNPYLMLGLIAGSIVVFLAIVAALTLIGMSLLIAFLTVYVITLWFMIGMQRRASQSFYSGVDQRRLLMRADAGNDSSIDWEERKTFLASGGSDRNRLLLGEQAAFDNNATNRLLQVTK